MTESADQQAGLVVVEQLSRTQWHAFEPKSGWRTAITTWPDAVSLALWAALLTDSGVESVDPRPEPAAPPPPCGDGVSAPVPAAAHDAVAPLLGFQSLLCRCRTAADRKRLVLSAWECGALDRRETGLLIQSNMLEAA